MSELLVREQHRLMSHAGVSTLVTAIRASYWIVGLRCLAKKVKRSCVSCQKQDAPSCNEQAAPLPESRATRAPPFSVTGVDHAGPVFCVDFPGRKFYITLFTCAVTRAVHLVSRFLVTGAIYVGIQAVRGEERYAFRRIFGQREDLPEC